MRCPAVATVADVARVTLLACRLQSGDCFSLAQFRFRTAMQLDDVDLVCLQILQAALDALQNRISRPIRSAFCSMRMAAFGKKIKLIAPAADRSTNQLFAAAITFRRVD